MEEKVFPFFIPMNKQIDYKNLIKTIFMSISKLYTTGFCEQVKHEFHSTKYYCTLLCSRCSFWSNFGDTNFQTDNGKCVTNIYV